MIRFLNRAHDDGGDGGAGGFDSQNGGGQADSEESALGGGLFEEGVLAFAPSAFGTDEGDDFGGGAGVEGVGDGLAVRAGAGFEP